MNLFNLRRPLNREYIYNGQFFDISYNWISFFVPSNFRFYEMNFFYWNLMPWEAFIPKYSLFFRVTYKNFQSGNFLRTCQAENFARHSKKCRIFGNKCFSRHQIPVEKIHLIESELTQNKEHHSIVRNVRKLTVLKIFSIKWST